MSCNICCDDYNKSTRTKVCCPYCEFEVCRACCETYILSESIPKCMKPECAKEWSRKFLRENFTNTFLSSKYKEHLENILFDQEKSLMPATQPIVEEKIRKRNIKKQMMEIESLIEDLRKQQRVLERSLLYGHNDSSTSNAKEDKNHFVRQCPANGCRGFLSTQWKCGICELWTCSECHELKGATRDCPHTCDPNNIETAKLLAKDSKPCPKCQSLIFKISGCFSENTPILMWDGSFKMSQDIKIGDILVGDDGEKRIVEDLVSGQDQLYEIRQNNADNYIVNSKHMLVLKFTGEKSINWFESINSWKIWWFDRNNKKITSKQFKVTDNCNKETSYQNAIKFLENLKLEDFILITVDDYLKLDKNTKNKLLGFRSSYGIYFESQIITLDPYLLGLWLGDGTHTDPIIASNDNEIKNYLSIWCENNDAELVQESKYKLRIRRKGYSFGKENIEGDKYNSIPDISERTNPFIDEIKKYNLIGNKHIPIEYLNNSREVRLKLLAGLIDTDGHVPKDQEGKRVVIIQSNEFLSKQIIKLARSLGFVVNYIIRERKNVKIFDCEPKDYKNQYVINISGENLSEIPTILPRKKCSNSKANKDYFRTSIEVFPIGKGNYYGWSVNHNNRFLLDDFTVVKNCDQMWCTQCHTAFSWKTGKLEKNIHNPHYYEWQRKNGAGTAPRNPGDIECGRELTHITCENIQSFAKRHPALYKSRDEQLQYCNWRGEKLTRSVISYDERIDLICSIVRNDIHNIRAELPNFQTNYVEKNQDLRVKYLENILDEEDFKILIQRNDKKNKKNTEVAQVIQLSNTALTDIIYRIIDFLQKKVVNLNELDVFINEITEIRNYCNNIFKDIAFTYNTVQYGFNINFSFIRIEKEKNPRKKKIEQDDDNSIASDDIGLKNIIDAAKKL
jgi:hypothetical protein